MLLKVSKRHCNIIQKQPINVNSKQLYWFWSTLDFHWLRKCSLDNLYIYINQFFKTIIIKSCQWKKKYEVFLINNFYLWLKIHTRSGETSRLCLKKRNSYLLLRCIWGTWKVSQICTLDSFHPQRQSRSTDCPGRTWTYSSSEIIQRQNI